MEIATQARDDAKNELTKADFVLTEAEKRLDAALTKVTALREKYNVAKAELNAQKWDYELKINQLYAAQARK